MILIYWKWKVWQAVSRLAEHMSIGYHFCDDDSRPISYDMYDSIIPSPWIPESHEIYSTGKVVSELDFAYRFLPKWFKTFSVTGTDGKSTTSWILYNILEKEFSVKENCNINDINKVYERNVYISWNFDIPFSWTVLEILKKWQKKWYIVLEVSSFMSYGIVDFQTDYSIFTNFRTDHLNWHKDLQDYFDAKMKLMLHTKKRAVINTQVLHFAHENNLLYVWRDNFRIFSFWKNTRDYTDGEGIIVSWKKKYLLSETMFVWNHNAMNILSCVLIMNELGVCSKRVREYIKDISWLSHRLEKIWEKREIIFVEDSKSTSSQSLEAALGSYLPKNTDHSKKNLLIIVGGSDKGDSFEHLSSYFCERVKAMVCIGATKEKFILIAKKENIPYLVTDSLSDWANWLYKQWNSGDILILSPGCASFWLFRDYFDRANQFREAIKNLPD